MARTAATWLIVVVCAVCARPAGAVTISIATIVPPTGLRLGDQAGVVFRASDLETTLGAYDLSLSFDRTILKPLRVVFPSALGVSNVITWRYDEFADPFGEYVPFEILDPGSDPGAITGAIAPAPDVVQAFSVSLLSEADLAARQGEFFLIVAIAFQALRAGTSPLSVDLDTLVLADGGGDPLVGTATDSAITVVPEPATLLLLTSGIPLVLRRARQLRKKGNRP